MPRHVDLGYLVRKDTMEMFMISVKPVLVTPDPPSNIFEGLTSKEEKAEALWAWTESLTEKDYCTVQCVGDEWVKVPVGDRDLNAEFSNID